MPYSATSYRLLISAPGDVPDEDVQRVMRAIARWNVNYGQRFAAVVVPLHWQLHSAAQHGVRPQAALNAQLVDEADMVIAIFWHRLGTSTGEAESGTVEEIEKAHAKGAYVAILQCDRDVGPRQIDPAQAARLETFFKRIRPESLVLSYETDADLFERVDTILTQAVTRFATRAEATTEPAPSGAAVWPRVESQERLHTSSSGRVSTRRNWQLVLANTGAEPARRVRFRLEAETPGDELPHMLDEAGELELLAPESEAGYPFALTMGVARQSRCVVTWEDSAGQHENVATLRFF